MKVDHIFPNHIYVITNFAVALNPIFLDRDLCKRFLIKLERYLSPICNILHYNLDDNQFQMIVKIKGRDAFCDFYRMKKGDDSLSDKDIPLSTHIFSQQMANLQSSTAIHFNRKFNRIGALFARRFTRFLVKSEEELKRWIKKLNSMQKIYQQTGVWKAFNRPKSRRSWGSIEKWRKERSAYYYYKNISLKHFVLSCFNRVSEMKLQGQFIKLPPSSIYLKKAGKSSP